MQKIKRANGVNWKIYLCLTSMALICLFVFLVKTAGSQTAPDLQLTILHTNDLHAHDQSSTEKGHKIAGMARLGHLIRALRRENPDAIVVDAGDIFQGTPFYGFYHGEVEVHLLNEIGYDLYTIGNHEFDDGPQNLAKQLKAAKFEILSSNIDASQFPELGNLIKPAAVKIIDGEKIGFVGAVTPELAGLALHMAPVKLKADGQNWMDPIKDEVKKLTAQGINKIILITHCGVDRDRELAQAIPAVDVIVGGHSHTRLEEPLLFTHAGGNATIIVQTGCYGRALGKLDLAFDKEGRLMFPNTHYKLINITGKVPEDADLKTYIQDKEKPLLALRGNTLATAVEDFDNKWLRTPCDSAIGDLISDALYEEGKKYGAQITFENRGGIRSNFEKGAITEENVEETLPFNNTLCLATVDGATLLAILEHSVGSSLGGRFLDEHGLKFAYDAGKDPGHRIVFALVQDGQGKWQPVDGNLKYRIGINNFSFSGGEGYEFPGATDKLILPDKISTILKKYLQAHKLVQPALPDRIAAVNCRLLDKQIAGDETLLQLHNLAPGARVTIATGDGIGVDALKTASNKELAVPLSNPHIIASDLVTAPDGEFVYHLQKSHKSTAAHTVTAIIEPPRHTGDSSLQIAAPLAVQ